MRKHGPHYDVSDCTGPNAKSLKAALAAKPGQAEIEELDRAIREMDTAPKPAPDAENRAEMADAGQTLSEGQQHRHGMYSVKYAPENEIEGEPSPEKFLWGIGPGVTEEKLDLQDAEAHAEILEEKMTWARGEIMRLREGHRQDTEHSDAARAVKEQVVSTLEELVPMAKRNAKRGKPALLRLITLAVKTKL